jgi:hypothetical protein
MAHHRHNYPTDTLLAVPRGYPRVRWRSPSVRLFPQLYVQTSLTHQVSPQKRSNNP